MAHQVVCFGEILWDCFGEIKKAGGAPMNVALHLYKQGTEPVFISSVGDDENGKGLIKFLQQQGLNTNYIQTSFALKSGIVDVHLDENQQATYTIVEPVAWDEIQYENQLEPIVMQADAFVFGSLASRQEISKATLLKLLKSARLKIFDMNLRPPHFEQDTLEELLQHANILKINEHELEYLSNIYSLLEIGEREQLLFLSQRFNIPTICVTLGDKGAILFQEGKFLKHPGFKVKVADTVGAGDAFLATFICGLLYNYPLELTLARACAAGALIASKEGANPEYTLADIFNICGN